MILTSKRLLYLVCTIFSLYISSASYGASGTLEWEIERLTIDHEGCNFPSDTLRLNIQNRNDSGMILFKILGAQNWINVNWSEISFEYLAPGESLQVELTYDPVYGQKPRFTTDQLIIEALSGITDTLTIVADIRVASLVAQKPDTLVMRPIEVGISSDEYVRFGHRGSVPFRVDRVWFEGDSTITARWLNSDSAITTSNGLAIKFTYEPRDAGSDTMSVFVTGSPCDEIYQHAIIFSSYRKTKPGPYWNVSTSLFKSPNCATPVVKEFTLHNGGSTDILIDSITLPNRFPQYPPSLFLRTSTPPDRFKNFVLSVGESIVYSVEYDPSIGTQETKLFMFSQSSSNDTIVLTTAVDGANFWSQSSHIVFGEMQPGVISVRTSEVTNYGPLDGVITDITREGNLALTITGIDVGDTIKIGETKQFDVWVQDSVPGKKETQLIIRGGFCDGAASYWVRATILPRMGVQASVSPKFHASLSQGSLVITHTYQSEIRYQVIDVLGRLLTSGSAKQHTAISIGATDERILLVLETPDGLKSIKLGR
jgi:hypothetical protein